MTCTIVTNNCKDEKYSQFSLFIFLYTNENIDIDIFKHS